MVSDNEVRLSVSYGTAIAPPDRAAAHSTTSVEK
jgi:hypothetical protein